MKSGTLKRKRTFEKAVPLNLTFQPIIIQAIDDLVRKGGFKGPAEYFANRVRKDAGLEPENQMTLFQSR
jgi:hypothetical protein